MSEVFAIERGLNIPLFGEAEKVALTAPGSGSYCIKPTDFHGLIPKLLVEEGDQVLAGTPLFYDKEKPAVKFTAPVSGEVVEVKRGEKRKLLSVTILPDKEFRFVNFKKAKPSELTSQEILSQMLDSGVWPFIRQRPYSTIADPDRLPKAIFISAFDTAPLAPDNDFTVHSHGDEFQAGVDALAKIAACKIYLNVNADAAPSKVFLNAKNVLVNKFRGPHPSGNVGVQIHKIDPINKGEVVWFLYPQDVLTIGRLFLEGKYNSSRLVAITGPSAKNRKYYRVYGGASIKGWVEYGTNPYNIRIISGNVLTGTPITADGHIGFYDYQLTMIPEGNTHEFMGWLAPGFDKFSHSRTFLSWMFPRKKFTIDTTIHGEERPFVMTGQYEDVFPMEIYPQHLIKSILINDIEGMEKLGIYEIAPEDFALCEFVCTSKMNLQQIVREGLDLIKKECG